MAENTKGTLKPARRLMQLLTQQRSVIRAIILYAIFIGLVNLSLPLGIQAIIGLILGGSVSASWVVLVSIVIIGMLFVGVLKYLQLTASEHIQRKLMVDSAFEFAVRIPNLNLQKVRDEHLPELINRFFDTLTLQKGLPKVLIDGSTAVLQIFLSLLVVSFYHPVFLSFSIATIVLLTLLFALTYRPGLESSLVESKYKYKIAYWLEELGRVASTFKLLGNTDMPTKNVNKLVEGYLDARQQHFRILIWQFWGNVFLRILIVGSFLIIGSLLVMDNSINLGQFVAAEILIILAVDSIEKVILLMGTVYDLLTATEKLGQFTDLELEREGGIKFTEICSDNRLSVEWRDLGFQFPDTKKEILKNLNYTIEAGKRVALTGYNSSGKSTLMQLNSGLIFDYTGTILFNGLPFKSLDIHELRANIGDLSSKEDIIKGTILENIDLGRNLPLSKIFSTIEEIGLQSFVQELPEGVNTLLLPSGKGLPGNIRSKILICRAIVCEPAFLVMEEPFHNISFQDRLKIGRYLTAENQPWTLLCLTQDPIFAAMCDEIIVLKDGEIVEKGDFNTIKNSDHFDRIFSH